LAESTNQEKQPYKYNGKEFDHQLELNWYDYGARFYDPLIGRFTTPDPLSEKYYSVSPYAYCANNPVNAVDPDGRDYWSTNDPELIRQFFNSAGRGLSHHDFSGWNHATDAQITGNLTYNDKTGKFYKSYSTVENGEIIVIGKSFDADLIPVSFDGSGYPGAFVYEYGSEGWNYAYYFACDLTPFSGLLSSVNPSRYYDGFVNWEVDPSGRITGAAPVTGYAPMAGKGKNGNIGKSKTSTKGMPHGDGGRALTQAEKRIAELEKQLQTASGKEKGKIEQKIINIQRTAQKKAKGVTHWRK